ncbi:NitT/TauT family transport system ATP-binding protein [Marininema mesophilum]|uniref:NitT/TauT family transport system ATP-binding protein n=1 Tax=Marininema mesophilum TaxID=1048340 RepID=A0A1H2S061_9BACL|nr:ABC transporter ATP-binding protein [Marininema mesophilum]SDW25122.1 NitT/TauT family transport system ATP-binding protein [Marininema mesophilum]
MAIGVLEADQVSKVYLSRHDQVNALAPISFRIQPGAFVSFVGASGCGKSTVLSLVAGLISPTAGELRLFGEPIKGPSQRISYMLQQDCLLDWRTVEQNITLGLSFRGSHGSKTAAHARYLLAELGLSHTLHQYPSQLSGGMRQRVALVRTLAVQPELLLLDEPFSALDYQNKLHLEELLVDVLHGRKMTALLVTHDLEEAIALSDTIYVMGGRPGTLRRIIEVPTEIRDASPLAARSMPTFRSLFIELWKEIESP